MQDCKKVMKIIDIKNLIFEYFRRDREGNVTEAIEALSDVSLDIQEGDFVAIVGKNGSGKSTLAKHINALLLPESGEVIVDGMDIEDETLRLSIRKTAGMVFQNPDNQIIANIVEEDVAFGPENLGVPTSEIWNRVDYALDATNTQDYRKKAPNHLSGGQKQRVAIAGVLAMEPKCIIFDEATAMLDPLGRKQILQVARDINKKKEITILLITHHMDEVCMADKVIVMDSGKVITEGTPLEIFAQKELLESCGLALPPLYQYINFLIGQEIVTKEEAQSISQVSQLVNLLIQKYKPSKLQTDNGKIPEQPQGIAGLTQGIYLDNVSYFYNKGYADEKIALKNVNLSIDKGEFVAVIGHTGSGKSTLLQHLNGLIFPTEGKVYYNGQDITEPDFNRKELRQKVGMVFQYPEYQLFAETVEQDVCFGPLNMDMTRVEAQKRAYEAIAMVGLPDTIYDYSPFELSGGQKRRVAIAGILAMQPEYLILDEPTAGLDPVSARELLTMLKELQIQHNISIVMVSHSMEDVAEFAERVVIMKEGAVCYDGTVSGAFDLGDGLKDLSLNIPVGISLLQALYTAGFDVDRYKCRTIDICGELLKLKNGL